MVYHGKCRYGDHDHSHRTVVNSTKMCIKQVDHKQYKIFSSFANVVCVCGQLT